MPFIDMNVCILLQLLFENFSRVLFMQKYENSENFTVTSKFEKKLNVSKRKTTRQINTGTLEYRMMLVKIKNEQNTDIIYPDTYVRRLLS